MRKTKFDETFDETVETLVPDPGANNVLDFSATLRDLKQSVDPQMVRHRAARRDRDGNLHMVDYVEWHTVADILDENAPNWAHTVKDIRAIGEFVMVTVAITIDGVTREGIGTGKANSETGIKKAEHDALKRSAVKFGIARELYKREFDPIDLNDPISAAIPGEIPNAADPVAKTLGDMVTAKQLGMIRAIAREASVDADAECGSLLRCRVDELSKRAASDLIEYLQGLRRNSDDAGVAMPLRKAG